MSYPTNPAPPPTPGCQACDEDQACGYCQADRRNNCPCRYPGHSFGYCCTPCYACGYCGCELSCTCASHGHGTTTIGPCWGLHDHAEDLEQDMRRRKSDKVDHPSHYGGRDDPYEAIKVIEAWGAGFNVGNALKYIRRAGKKEEKDSPASQDYKKACWYLLRELALEEGCLDPNRYTDMLSQAPTHAQVEASLKSKSCAGCLGAAINHTCGKGPCADCCVPPMTSESGVCHTCGRRWGACAAKTADAQIEKLANWIMTQVPGEPSQNEGAVDTAIRIMSRANGLQKAMEEASPEVTPREAFLFTLLDDIDTMDDAARGDSYGFRESAVKAARRRFDCGITSDGYKLALDDEKVKALEDQIGNLKKIEQLKIATRELRKQLSYTPLQTMHQKRVESMMLAFGQEVPAKPTQRDAVTRVLRARLILEEALETIQDGLRVSVSTTKAKFRSDDMEQVEIDFDELHFVPKEGKANLVELADGCADVSVVTIGTLSAFGIKDARLLEEVDGNNLDKVNKGKVNEHGKFEKHPDHKPPEIAKILYDQGLREFGPTRFVDEQEQLREHSKPF